MRKWSSGSVSVKCFNGQDAFEGFYRRLLSRKCMHVCWSLSVCIDMFCMYEHPIIKFLKLLIPSTSPVCKFSLNHIYPVITNHIVFTRELVRN